MSTVKAKVVVKKAAATTKPAPAPAATKNSANAKTGAPASKTAGKTKNAKPLKALTTAEIEAKKKAAKEGKKLEIGTVIRFTAFGIKHEQVEGPIAIRSIDKNGDLFYGIKVGEKTKMKKADAVEVV